MRGEDWLRYHCLQSWLRKMERDGPKPELPGVSEEVRRTRHAAKCQRLQDKLAEMRRAV